VSLQIASQSLTVTKIVVKQGSTGLSNMWHALFLEVMLKVYATKGAIPLGVTTGA
jgi:hypothetical protein